MNAAQESDSVQAKGKAIVRVTIAIDVQGSWGETCTLGQVTKQACDVANAMLRHPENFANAIKERRVSIVGSIEVERIIVPQN